MDDPDKFITQLSIICKYSPFKSEAELMKQFDAVYGERGKFLIPQSLIPQGSEKSGGTEPKLNRMKYLNVKMILIHGPNDSVKQI